MGIEDASGVPGRAGKVRDAVSGAREVGGDFAARLAKAASELDDARTQAAAALDRRDQIIVEADREGMSQRAIARFARVSQPHVIRVVAAAALKDTA